MLKKEPVAVSHVAGEDVVHVKAIHEAGTVVHEVHHLTTKLDPFVETHIEQTGILVLRERTRIIGKVFRDRSIDGLTFEPGKYQVGIHIYKLRCRH